jgi:hypothetical protein
MSAFIVSHDHIDAILAGYAKARKSYEPKLSIAQLTELGQLLLIENSRSVAYRYNEPVNENWRSYIFDITCLQKVPVPVIAQQLKLCSCLEYQSCERPDYEESDAYKLLERIRGDLISALPGYDAGPWEYIKREAA